MTHRPDEGRVHRFVTIEHVTRAEQPAATDLRRLFGEWGLTRSTQEAFWVIAIDNMTGLKTVTEVARGGFHDVMVFTPAVLSAVLAAQTDRFYVAHNHPAGPITPTMEDVDLTGNLMRAANMVGLSFEDHIIVGPPDLWFSFYEEGLIQRPEKLGIAAMAAKEKKRRG